MKETLEKPKPGWICVYGIVENKDVKVCFGVFYFELNRVLFFGPTGFTSAPHDGESVHEGQVHFLFNVLKKEATTTESDFYKKLRNLHETRHSGEIKENGVGNTPIPNHGILGGTNQPPVSPS